MTSQRIVIEASRGWAPINLIEVWRYRELGYALARREVLVRYKQSFFGVGWAVIQPVLTMVVFTVIFSALLGRQNMPSPAGIPYELSTFAALLPWQLFSQSVSRASLSIVNSQNLITKVYFPRLLLPLAPVMAALVDFTIAFTVLLLLMLWWNIVPGTKIVFLPLFVAMAVAAALSISLWLSGLNVMYRDIQHAIPFLLQIFMYVSPIVYFSDAVLANMPEWVKTLYWMNPMVGVAEGFRWVLLGAAPLRSNFVGAFLRGNYLFLISGLYFFKRLERKFSDIV